MIDSIRDKLNRTDCKQPNLVAAMVNKKIFQKTVRNSQDSRHNKCCKYSYAIWPGIKNSWISTGYARKTILMIKVGKPKLGGNRVPCNTCQEKTYLNELDDKLLLDRAGAWIGCPGMTADRVLFNFLSSNSKQFTHQNKWQSNRL